MGRLEGRAAIVTGASRGIGRAVAERLATDGARLVIGYRSHSEEASAVVDACTSRGGEAMAVHADLADLDQIPVLFDEAMSRFGRLDIVVNNAGVAAPTPFTETIGDTYDRIFAVNTHAVFASMHQAGQRMADGGRIVNISTLNTVAVAPGFAAYIASKAAVEAFTRVAAKELGSRGITVNAVLPGATDTEMFRSANPPGAIEEMAGLSPLQRVGQPSDIADVVAWLASDEARWITGQLIRADGGVY